MNILPVFQENFAVIRLMIRPLKFAVVVKFLARKMTGIAIGAVARTTLILARRCVVKATNLCAFQDHAVHEMTLCHISMNILLAYT